MRAFVVPPTLPNDHPKTRSVIGDDWLDRRVNAAWRAMQQRNNLSPSAIGMTFGKLAHPLVAELYALAVNSDALGTPQLDLLELDLTKLGSKVPDDLHGRLRNDEESTKVIHELRIAAGLNRLGHRITWLSDEGAKRPELIVDADSDSAISVECKKRDRNDGYEAQADKFWNHFQYGLRQPMDEGGLNFWVKLTAREFRLRDVDLIVRQTLEELHSNDHGSALLSNGRYHLEYLRLADAHGSLPSEILALIPRGVYGVNHGEVNASDVTIPTREGGAFSRGPVMNPRAIRLELTDDPNRRIRGVLRSLKTAARQLLPDLPGVVYIDLSFRSYDEETSDFDSVVEAVTSELKRAHRRASAVVLTAIEPTRLMDGFPVWSVRTALIRHPDALNPLPEPSDIPGEESSRWLPGQWLRPKTPASGPEDPAPLYPWGEPVEP